MLGARVALPETRKELISDIVFGLGVPTLLLASNLNPFSDGPGGPARFPYLAPATYVASVIGWTLAALRLSGRTLTARDYMAGGFAGVALLACVAGAALLSVPLHLVPLAVVVGGFIPFVSALCLARLAHRTLAASLSRKASAFLSGLAVVVMACLAPSYWTWTNDKERVIQENLSSLGVGHSLALHDVVPGRWTRATAFGGYTPGSQVDRELGFLWNSSRKRVLERSEGIFLIVFSTRERVLHSVVLRQPPRGRYCLDDAILRRVKDRCDDK